MRREDIKAFLETSTLSIAKTYCSPFIRQTVIINELRKVILIDFKILLEINVCAFSTSYIEKTFIPKVFWIEVHKELIGVTTIRIAFVRQQLFNLFSRGKFFDFFPVVLVGFRLYLARKGI